MLLDRACPRGGWNAGNSVVFGVELDPHPDFTAMAALALLRSGRGKQALAGRSLDYLAVRLVDARSPYSLAWATIALSAYGHEGADRLRSRLEASLASRVTNVSPATLGVAALALEHPAFAFEESVL
jgi:hypothetical protein